MSDEFLSLNESTYEFIHTDEESQDGQSTGSICSSHETLSDDRSLIGHGTISNYYDEDGHTRNEAIIASQVASRSLMETTFCDTPNAGSMLISPPSQYMQDRHLSFPTLSESCSVKSLDHSIKLDEILLPSSPDRTLASRILHISDNTESQISRVHDWQESDSIAMILRQTMSIDNMVTHRPFRVLYIGSESAQHDILYKISSALISPTIQDHSESRPCSSDMIFNIIPVSDFGVAQIPDVELMPTSPFQIVLEACIAASEIQSSSKTRYQLKLVTASNEKKIVSLPNSESLAPDPWELPHMAVFYCAKNDDSASIATRDAAWRAMVSCGTPCIFIAHHIDYKHPPLESWLGHLAPDVLHISLEPKLQQPGQSVSTRLPVDLATFLAIDACQMHRHFAFITGLGVASGSIDKSGQMPKLKLPRHSLFTVLVAIILSLTLTVGFLSQVIFTLRNVSNESASTPISAATATFTVETTSTETKQLHSPVSVIPWLFDQALRPVPNTAVFRVSVGPNSIFLQANASFAHKSVPGRLRVSVWRANQPIVANLIVHDDKFMEIELGKRETCGFLTLTLESTHEPIFQEKYEVDLEPCLSLWNLSLSHVQQVMMQWAIPKNEGAMAASQSVPSEYPLFEKLNPQWPRLWRGLDRVRDYTASTFMSVSKKADQQLGISVQQVTSHYSTFHLALSKAQISSRLLWLKFRGQRQGYERYEHQAVEYLSKKTEDYTRWLSKVDTNGSPGLDWRSLLLRL